AMAMSSPYDLWDDVSGHFRCCASQDACFDVATCGGWLAHPAPGSSCEKLCDCLGQYMTVPSWPADVQPPQGYRFASNAMAMEGSVPHAISAYPGVEIIGRGRVTTLRFSFPIQEHRLRALAGGARSLPTFYDGAGRLAVAMGDIFIELGDMSQVGVLRARAKSAHFSPPEAVSFGRNLFRIASADPWKSLRALPHLRSIPKARVELDMLRYYKTHHIPNDPLFLDQWHLRNTGQHESISGVDGRVTEAWDTTMGTPEVVIAINDDGVDVTHPDLAASCLEPLNFPSDWQEQMTDPLSGFGAHGTSVAGVAASIADNGQGGAGVCPRCRIMPHLVGEKVGPTGLSMTDQGIANGFVQMVDEGAWVINNSWGPGGGDPNFAAVSFPIPAASSVVKAAFTYAETHGRNGKGTVVVFAAGNENEMVSAYGKEPTMVTVAAVDDQGLKAYYSNRGPQVLVAAPSNGGIRGIVTTSAGSQYTDSFGGTSSASPFVAGVAGLILSANPDLTAAQVRDILAQSATKVDPVWGDYDENGHSPYYGYGLVNAAVAVRLASGSCTDPADCPAPSDDCGTNCSKAACDACRTTADCEQGLVCQALPPLGRSVCVAGEAAGCPAGTSAHRGYCIPTRSSCGLCAASETCNGRDDDCNGQVDENLDCTGVRVLQCPLADEGCSASEACAATVCVPSCQTDADCGEDANCRIVKDRYGKANSLVKGCAKSLVGTCKSGCDILASTMTDDQIEDFVSCMKDGKTSCMAAFGCASKLPIKM
ncbi:MAG TPA: S8 family serine peptidase, partial [Polyangiaceae bacterium]|nr:S8 family serine peptidase [Polyangiaceae bacterium]